MTERMIIIDAILKMAMVVVTAVLIPAIKGWLDRNADNKEGYVGITNGPVAVQVSRD